MLVPVPVPVIITFGAVIAQTIKMVMLMQVPIFAENVLVKVPVPLKALFLVPVHPHVRVRVQLRCQ